MWHLNKTLSSTFRQLSQGEVGWAKRHTGCWGVVSVLSVERWGPVYPGHTTHPIMSLTLLWSVCAHQDTGVPAGMMKSWFGMTPPHLGSHCLQMQYLCSAPYCINFSRTATVSEACKMPTLSLWLIVHGSLWLAVGMCSSQLLG